MTINKLQAQQILQAAGLYTGALDGDFGNKSWAAVVSALLTQKIAYSKNDTSLVMAVQIALNRLGYNAGSVDGVFGAKTQAAIGQFVQAQYKDAAWSLTVQDILKLGEIKPQWALIVNEAIKIGAPRFRILEGIRTVERQKQLVKQGASQTMRSRHLTGDAVDIAPIDAEDNVSWAWPQYYKLEPFIKQAAKNLGIKIEWGGDWQSFKDGPHWQFPW